MSVDTSLSPLARNRDLLESILRRGGGNLEEAPYPILLLAMALGETSGALELRRNQLQKTIIFDIGSPVDSRSNIATETFGRYLVSNGKVSEQDCHAAFATAASRGVPLGEILTERELMTPTELYRALQQNLGRKLLDPFSWKSGTWALSTDVPPIGSALRVRVPQLLVTGILKVEPQESADAAVAVAYGKYLALADEPLFGLENLKLTSDQKKVVEAARAGTSFDQFQATGGIDTDDLHRILYSLLLLGIIVVTPQSLPQTLVVEVVNPFFDDPADAPLSSEVFVSPFSDVSTTPAGPETAVPAVLETPRAASPPTVPPVAASEPTGEPPASAEEVMSAFLSYRRKDSFDLLGIQESDSLPAAAEAFIRICEKFLPSRFDPAAADGVRDKAQEVLLAAAKAFAELSDAGRRETLVKNREGLRQLAAATLNAPPALIDPEALYQSGKLLLAAGKTREALSSFEMAAECDAQNGTYAAEAAWCRFQLNDSPAATVLRHLKNAIRTDPKSGLAFLHAGNLQITLGNRLEAQAYLSRAATLLPHDPRPAAALKEAGFPAA